MAERLSNLRLLFLASALVLTACGGSDNDPPPAPPPGGEVEPPAPPPPPPPPAPPPSSSNVPTISPEVVAAAEKITSDAQVAAVVQDLLTPENAKGRFNQHMELVRIASPSRYEYRMAAEIHRRMAGEWGFSPDEVKTSADGNLPGSDVQIVDGMPVYNACVEIKGSYSSTPGAQSYNGQFPKVLVESHIDVVNPEVLPPDSNPYQPIRLQPISQPIVTLPSELDMIADQLAFDAGGRIVEDSNYAQASRWFKDANAARDGGGVRRYVPGIGDAMGNTTGVMTLAQMMKKHNIKPVYDIWICGTAGEEGKGNLAGMKQLYGYDQDRGTGTNPLNFVTNFGNEGGGSINFLGSYRFEMKYKAPATPGPNQPSALEAMAATVAKIADVRTPSELREGAPRTTYTVGQASCEAPASGSTVVPSCTILVDMRSPLTETLDEVRAAIEPLFQAGVSDENARYGAAEGSAQAVTKELVWFGLRPAHVNQDKSDIAIQAGWQAAQTVGVDKQTQLDTGAGSLNDNVPAAIGVPTYNWNLASTAGSGGTHAFWEWSTRGNPDMEALRIQRAMTAALISAGFHAADGTVVPPLAGPIGPRTAQVQ
ncbi:peptidase M20 [Variovorax sp.]|uniref:peptidase M20 n=1 Tax=Variovorax sp. TaxID=1871043 RepID=UPI002D6BBEBC|nr:peptidase M20 [Variovorax sp.]HYP83149.1 peptidase M20 [Variovorax sp.]